MLVGQGFNGCLYTCIGAYIGYNLAWHIQPNDITTQPQVRQLELMSMALCMVHDKYVYYFISMQYYITA